MDGYVYGTKEQLLGYRIDAQPAAATTISLADLLDADEEQPRDDLTSKPSRRRRRADGARLRGKIRRWNAMRTPEERKTALAEMQATEIGWRPPTSSGLWLFDTTNPNCWATGVKQIVQRTTADVILMQETKVRATKVQAVRSQAERAGWRSHFGAALVTPKLGTSGGAAVLSRKGLGSSPHDMVEKTQQHRIAGAWIGAVVKGGIHCFSIYLKDGDGMSDTNAAILTELAAAVAAVRGPWLIGGDWNVNPKALADSGWPEIVRGTIQAPVLPTCNTNVYDFFVVSNDLSAAVAGVVRLSDGGCKPHWTSRLFLHADARAKAVRRLIKPERIPGKLPHGPLNKSDAVHSEPCDARLDTWYARARSVWHSLLTTQQAATTHKFRWEAATGKIACAHMGATTVSAELRALARKIDDAATLLEKGTPPDDPRIRMCTVSNA